MKDILKPGEVNGACFLVYWFLGEGGKPAVNCKIKFLSDFTINSAF